MNRSFVLCDLLLNFLWFSWMYNSHKRNVFCSAVYSLICEMNLHQHVGKAADFSVQIFSIIFFCLKSRVVCQNRVVCSAVKTPTRNLFCVHSILYKIFSELIILPRLAHCQIHIRQAGISPSTWEKKEKKDNLLSPFVSRLNFIDWQCLVTMTLFTF